MRQVYVNGEFVAESDARISVFDRGFLFADSVYEVTAVLDGKLVDFAGHVRRLRRSLGELFMPFFHTDEQLLAIHRELVQRNGLHEGLIYMQVTRGAVDRDFLFPPADTPNGLVLFTQAKPLANNPLLERGMRIVTVGDIRWGRCDIKTTQLLFASITKTAAVQQGADDAWLLRDGLITEGTASNAYIITRQGVLVTRNLSNALLAGITRASLLALVQEQGLSIEERPFTPAEALQAAEAFVTAAATLVMPVVSIDGQAIGDGKPGARTLRLRELYIAHSRAQAV